MNAKIRAADGKWDFNFFVIITKFKRVSLKPVHCVSGRKINFL